MKPTAHFHPALKLRRHESIDVSLCVGAEFSTVTELLVLIRVGTGRSDVTEAKCKEKRSRDNGEPG
jgi:hypothetical protein